MIFNKALEYKVRLKLIGYCNKEKKMYSSDDFLDINDINIPSYL